MKEDNKELSVIDEVLEDYPRLKVNKNIRSNIGARLRSNNPYNLVILLKGNKGHILTLNLPINESKLLIYKEPNNGFFTMVKYESTYYRLYCSSKLFKDLLRNITHYTNLESGLDLSIAIPYYDHIPRVIRDVTIEKIEPISVDLTKETISLSKGCFREVMLVDAITLLNLLEIKEKGKV